jgi:hypothetical protein
MPLLAHFIAHYGALHGPVGGTPVAAGAESQAMKATEGSKMANSHQHDEEIWHVRVYNNS